jgi:regulator of protease activity HflC (stomatin/prohibitin superfamily)
MGIVTSIQRDEQLILHTWTDKKLINGPSCFVFYNLCYRAKKNKMMKLNLYEYVLIMNEIDPKMNRYVYGPQVVLLESAYESFSEKKVCPILDQDDYIIVSDSNGVKRTIHGPCVYKPVYGETSTCVTNATTVPMNHYIIVKDTVDSDEPIKHLRGPLKFVPEPYQSIVENKIHKCLEITDTTALHVKLANGNTILIDKKMWYMPQIGEEIVKVVNKVVMLESEFCILKSPNGETYIMDGSTEENRAFFLNPFYEFIEFDFEHKNKKQILSKLPTFICHEFIIRTSDNVLLKLDLRITYQIQNTQVFASNPLPFYLHLTNWCQNELLDLFAKVNLRDYVQKYNSIAFSTISHGTEYFSQFGIHIIDIQILNYTCVDIHTQQLLDEDIKTYVKKQNELKAKEADIFIKEKENEILKRKKDLDVELFAKDREIEMKNKELEISLRLKNVEFAIEEEKKKIELLNIKRESAVIEAKFEGKSQGETIHEFLNTFSSDIPVQTRIDFWNSLRELDKAQMIYSKVNNILMYPPNSDLKFFQIDKDVVQSNQMILPSIMTSIQ